MKKIFIIVIICFSFLSCSPLKRQRTITEITEIIKVDTIIKIQVDTITYYNYSQIYDTVKLETKHFKIISYVDTITKKIFIEGQAKPFEQTISIDKKTTTKTEVKKTERQSNILLYIFGGLIIGLIIFKK